MSNKNCEKGIVSPFLNSCEPFVGSCAKLTVVSVYLSCDGRCTATIKIENAVGNLQGEVWFEAVQGVFYLAIKAEVFDLPNGTHDVTLSTCSFILLNAIPIKVFAVSYGITASEKIDAVLPKCKAINIVQFSADCVGEGLEWAIEFDASGTSGDYLVQVLISGVWTTMATEIGVGTDGTFNINPASIPTLTNGTYDLRLVDAADSAIVSNTVSFGVNCEASTIVGIDSVCEGTDQTLIVAVDFVNADGDYEIQYESAPGVWTTIHPIGMVSGTATEEYEFVVVLPTGATDIRVYNTYTEYATPTQTTEIQDCSSVPEPFIEWLVLGKIDAAYNGDTGFTVFSKSSVDYNAMVSPAPTYGWVLERYDGAGIFALQYVGSGNVGDDLSFALDANAEYRLQLQSTTAGMFASSRMMFKTDAGGQITDYISAGQTSMPNSPSDGVISCHEHLATSLLFGLGATQWEAFTPGGIPGTGVPLIGPDPVSPYSALTGVKWTTWFFNYADMPAGVFLQVDENPAGGINQHMGTKK